MTRSARLGRFVGLHSEFVEPFWTAREISRNSEWFDFTALKRDNGLAKIRPDQKILPDLTKIMPDIAIYTAEDIYDITLVADHSHILRPDLSVEVMEGSDWFEKGRLSVVKRHHAAMKPRFGTFIVCLEKPPQAALDELAPKPAAVDQPASTEASGQPASASVAEPAPDIHILEVGYNQESLQPIIWALSEAIPSA
jgi:hypothetical protein